MKHNALDASNQQHLYTLNVNETILVTAEYAIIGGLCAFCAESEGLVTIGRVM